MTSKAKSSDAAPTASPHYNVRLAGTSTSTLSYLSILTKVRILRAGAWYGSALGRVFGELEKTVKPHQTVVLKSSKDKRRKIQINFHLNEAALKLQKEGKDFKTAVHLTWHGSGWILRGLGQDAAFLRQTLSNPALADYPLTVLDCDYAKSPEYPCPADMDDAMDVWSYVQENSARFDLDRITVGGFSAGASIALGLCVALGEGLRKGVSPDEVLAHGHGASRVTLASTSASTAVHGPGQGKAKSSSPSSSSAHPIKAVFAVYPVATWEGSRAVVSVPKEHSDKPGYLLPVWFSKLITTAHLFSPTHPSNLTPEEERARKEELISRSTISPLNAEDVSDFPESVVLITAEFDHLTRDTEVLRERLHKEGPSRGIEVYGGEVKGVGHGWDEVVVKKGKKGFQERNAVYDLAARMISKAGRREADMELHI